jgi:hypothetical protein
MLLKRTDRSKKDKGKSKDKLVKCGMEHGLTLMHWKWHWHAAISSSAQAWSETGAQTLIHADRPDRELPGTRVCQLPLRT